MEQITPFFRELFTYNHHCNQQLADLMMAHQDMLTERAIKLFSHVLNAHHIWNNRIASAQPGYKVWQEQAVNDWKEIDRKNYEDSLGILSTTDMTQVLAYHNSQGLAFSNSVRDILFHVINHSNYHRAQIASDMKSVGITPLTTDYIFYKR